MCVSHRLVCASELLEFCDRARLFNAAHTSEKCGRRRANRECRRRRRRHRRRRHRRRRRRRRWRRTARLCVTSTIEKTEKKKCQLDLKLGSSSLQ